MSWEGWDRNNKEIQKFTTCGTDVAVRTKVCQDNGETINVSVDPSTTPTITNLTLTNPVTEYQHTFQSNVKRFTIKARNSAKLQFSFSSGQSGTNYFTIERGCTYDESGLKVASLDIYLQSDKGSTIVEILEWQ